ncbi:MAG: MerR family transcriptional regulator [Edaphocola sp.]
METRVLTLFDDEEFLPQPEPKKKKSGNAQKDEPRGNAGEETQNDTVTAEQPTDIKTESVEVPGFRYIEEQQGDDYLDKQILGELVQADYAALLHEDYPFGATLIDDTPKPQMLQEKQPEANSAGETDINQGDEEPTEDDDVTEHEEPVPLPDWDLRKNYYSIGEVAKFFAVNTSHIRFWTTEFKLKPRTTRKGDRLYTPADIAELRLIHHLVKEKKHTIKGAREKIKSEKVEVNKKLDLKESLIQLRHMLEQIKINLK